MKVSSNQSSRLLPPRSDEFEVSIIGPGRGECVIIHLGNNVWIVVDSCKEAGSKTPVAVDYLQGINSLDGVQLVVATHWHDDHIKGLADIVGRVPSAKFCCSAALGSREFATLVSLAGESAAADSGLGEFQKIFALLLERKQSIPTRLITPILASEHKRLFYLDPQDHFCATAITALSPSDGTTKAAIAAFVHSLPKAGEQTTRLTVNQNDTSVALWIQFGDQYALLGGDLEETGHQGEGWKAVIEGFQGKSQAHVYKVPHHGSSNAHNEEVWQKLLIENPVAVVTPFAPILPKTTDIERLKKLTNQLYRTSTGTKPTPRRDSLVEKETKSIKRKVIEGRPGHVRVRWSVGEPTPSVDVFHGAEQVR